MDENVTVTLTLDQAVRNLIQLTALDIMLAKDVLAGNNVENNLNMLATNNNVQHVIYEQIEDEIVNSDYCGMYTLYCATLHTYLLTVEAKLNGESDENYH